MPAEGSFESPALGARLPAHRRHTRRAASYSVLVHAAVPGRDVRQAPRCVRSAAGARQAAAVAFAFDACGGAVGVLASTLTVATGGGGVPGGPFYVTAGARGVHTGTLHVATGALDVSAGAFCGRGVDVVTGRIGARGQAFAGGHVAACRRASRRRGASAVGSAGGCAASCCTFGAGAYRAARLLRDIRRSTADHLRRGGSTGLCGTGIVGGGVRRLRGSVRRAIVGTGRRVPALRVSGRLLGCGRLLRDVLAAAGGL